MSNLFFKALSQGLQGFLPVAAALVWAGALGAPRVSAAIKWGLVAAMPLSILGADLFQASTHQARDEATLAWAAVVLTIVSSRALRRPRVFAPDEPGSPVTMAIAAAASLLVVRQTMEIVSVLRVAAFQLRSFDATTAIASGAVLAGFLAWASTVLWNRLPLQARVVSLWAFCTIFLAQGLLYAVHESAEAGMLPWSDVLHAATEPYGPDGLCGVHFSDLLIVGPLAGMALLWLRDRPRLRARRAPSVLGNATAVVFAPVLLLGLQQGDARPPQASPSARPADIAAVAAGPHLLFRNTGAGADFGRLAVASLDNPDGARHMIGMTCQRVSFASGHGLCLHLERGVFNIYSAVLLDKALTPGASVKLEGLPSRTRTSPDGKLGAVTVFVIGDDYAADFSTRTTLIDLASGDEIGELEQFSTWRDGVRFRSVDFNFWGVTFARDGNTFYAALRTAGKTYLVRGVLALRRLTVLRENVECPSLSPDNRRLAYKKRVGPGPDSWRVHVLDLQANTERIVEAEKRFVDDQVEWLDDTHVLYSISRRTTSTSDVWVASIDGAEPARVLISRAESPIVVR